MQSTINSFSWATIANACRIIFQFVGIIVLGRLLSPNDYGIIGIMAVFIAIGDMLIDSGMNGAILQKREVTSIDYSTLFVYNTTISVFLYVVFFLSASSIASYYGIPELQTYIRFYCLVLVLYAVGLSANTKLQKEMCFQTIAKVQILCSGISLAIGIIMAYNGMGVWALIFQTLVYSALLAVLNILVSGTAISISFSWLSFKQQFSFGMWLMFSSFIDTICNNIYTNIIPKISTIESNGCYSRANSLTLVPQNLITSVTSQVLFPLLSNSGDKRTEYKKCSGTISYISFFLFTLISVFSPAVIKLLLGSQWTQASWYLQILSFAGAFLVYQNLQRNLLKAYGKTKEVFRLQLLKTIIKVLTIVIPLVYMSLQMLVCGILICNIINSIVSIKTIEKTVDISFFEQVTELAKFCLCSLALFISIPLLSKLFSLSDLGSLILLPIGIIIFVFMAHVFKIESQYLIFDYLNIKRKKMFTKK